MLSFTTSTENLPNFFTAGWTGSDKGADTTAEAAGSVSTLLPVAVVDCVALSSDSKCFTPSDWTASSELVWLVNELSWGVTAPIVTLLFVTLLSNSGMMLLLREGELEMRR